MIVAFKIKKNFLNLQNEIQIIAIANKTLNGKETKYVPPINSDKSA